MTLPGGPADKFGNRYETWWTVAECVRLLHGDTEAIRIELPGVEKAEFVVTAGARQELHQAKRSHRSGKWSLAVLAADGLLQAMGGALAGNNDRFVFVSGSDARELADLCEAANDAKSEEEFKRAFIAAEERRQSFERLHNCHWKCTAPTAFERLRRIEVRTINERELEEKVRWGAQALFLADPGGVLAALRAIVEDSVHRTITRQELVEELSRRGYRMRHLRCPERAGLAVQEATDLYLEGARRQLIRQTLVPRATAEALLSRLGEAATDNVVTGKAGSGKTACVVEVTEALRERGVHGEQRVEKVGEADAVRLGHQPERGPVPVEAPRAPLLHDFEARLVVTVQDLLGDLAGGRAVDQGERVRAVPFDADDGDGGGGVGCDAAHRSRAAKPGRGASASSRSRAGARPPAP